MGSGIVSGCTFVFSWMFPCCMFYCILTQLLTVELYIMILEVTLTCISVQDLYLERLEFSSVSFTCYLFIYCCSLIMFYLCFIVLSCCWLYVFILLLLFVITRWVTVTVTYDRNLKLEFLEID